jgi:hypothetical protein
VPGRSFSFAMRYILSPASARLFIRIHDIDGRLDAFPPHRLQYPAEWYFEAGEGTKAV